MFILFYVPNNLQVNNKYLYTVIILHYMNEH